VPRSLTATERDRGAMLVEEQAKRAAYKVRRYFPDDGPYRRELYAKHVAFFEAGAAHRERLLLAANRVGKTECGAYELALHTTGLYDLFAPWWRGRRFDRPVACWAAGDTGKTVRDILQAALLGTAAQPDSGMLPAHLIHHTTRKTGLPDTVENIWIRHASGGLSTISLKSYDQRREAFQGTAQDVVWLDEECPEDIYAECLLRTMTTDGLLMLTFTPLMGLTPLVLSFLPDGKVPH
jgi:phage terminase large subunit-like protein